MLIRSLSALLLTASLLLAQNGDKPGEKQTALIPADKIPPAPPLPADEAVKTFRVPPGFKVEVVASEPLVETPVVVQWDPNGRLWVVEMRAFMPNPEGAGETEPVGRVSILEDTDGDGRMDRKKVFLDGLVMPRAMAFAHGGVLVCVPPQLLFYPVQPDDTPGPPVVVDTRYAPPADPALGRRMNPEHAPNSLLWTLDNWIYSANSTFKYQRVEDDWKKLPTAFHGQWGLSQDNHGRLAFNSNSDHLRLEPVRSEYLFRNPFHRTARFSIQPLTNQVTWPARINPGVNRGYQKATLRPDGRLAKFTGACGPSIYRGDNFPPEFVGDAFVCEPTGNFIRRDKISEKNGEITAINPYAAQEQEFLGSTDEIFRPVNTYTGPDGALYLVDMYHGIIQHRYFLTSYLRKQAESRGLDKVIRHGRIYRVVHTGKPLGPKPGLGSASPAELVAALSHPNGWWRDTAQRLLVESTPGAAVALLKETTLSGKNPLGRLHALWTLGGMGYLDQATVLPVLKRERDPKVLAAAIRVAEPLLKTFQRDEILPALAAHAGTKAFDVQLQLALSLGEVTDGTADVSLVKIATANSGNGFIRDAILSGLAGREADFIGHLSRDSGWKQKDAAREKLLNELARCVIVAGRREKVNQVLDLVADEATPAWQKSALIVGMTPVMPKAAKGMTPMRIKKIQLPEPPAALDVLRKGGDKTVLQALAKLEAVLVWPGKPGVKPEPPVRPLNETENTRYQVGKALYETSCGACHQLHGFGMEGLAPPLADSEWVAGPDARLIRIVLHGMTGPVSVAGRKHDLDMPGHGLFDDDQIAAVLTYIRREWDHGYEPVNPRKVAQIRQATAAREEAWTEKELLSIK